MTSQNSIIQIDKVNVVIKEKIVLKNISVTIGSGELVVIVGPNGAGKSTFLKILTGIQNFNSGSVKILNHEVKALMRRSEIRNLRSEIAQVFQGLHLVPRLNVLENILIGRLSLNRSFKTWARVFNKADHTAALEAMQLVGISPMADARVDRLSGGERQKVAIARALAQNTRLILADEPTSNLDPQAAAEIAMLLNKLVSEKNITIVVVLHDLSLLPHLGGRVLGLRNGTLQFDHQNLTAARKEIELIYQTEKI